MSHAQDDRMESPVVVEIGDRHLPARMVIGRVRSEIRQYRHAVLPLPARPGRHLATGALLALIATTLHEVRTRQAA